MYIEMKFVFPKPKSVELLAELKVARSSGPAIEKRPKVDIAVIDDQPFAPFQNLTNHGFRLQRFSDVSTIKQINGYPVVLCDLQGVGKELNKSLQGAHLIKEIKRNYPEKVVIAYTGGSQNANVTKLAFAAADGFLPKDEHIEKWVDSLDEAIGLVTDPIRTWKITRSTLLEHSATVEQVMWLEDAYVGACQGSYEGAQRVLQKSTQSLSLAPLAKGVMENLIASAALKLVFGT
jgi:DNA-binding NarL/FixJ family response regulator